MTVSAYITDKLRAFGITEAQLADVSLESGLVLDADIAGIAPKSLGTALARALEEAILAPKQASVNENGFSVSWDFDSAASYYLWLCRKWGVTPQKDILSMMGLSSIADKSRIW